MCVQLYKATKNMGDKNAIVIACREFNNLFNELKGHWHVVLYFKGNLAGKSDLFYFCYFKVYQFY